MAAASPAEENQETQEAAAGVEISDLPNWEDSEAPLKQSLVLEDGSRIVGGVSNRLRISKDTSQTVIVIQEEGVASFFVVSKDTRSFQVQAGDVSVTTTGGEFEVERSVEATHVTVRTGSARVRHQGDQHLLQAGQSQTFAVTQPLRDTVADSGKPAVKKKSVSDDWRQLAQRADYEAAYAVMQKHPEVIKNTSADLMLAADVARFSRHPGQAAHLLGRVASEFSGDPLAPLAAFTRGRVFVENLGQSASAASAFAHSRSLSPNGSLAADALIREIDARASVGQQKQVRALASEYLSSYPQGRHRTKCEKLVNPD